jgi:predicted HD phosphohydrolase
MGRLSGPSVTSLMLQGGPMSPAEQEAFRGNPHWQAALRLRRYDEAAKVAGAATPSLAHFLPLLARVARA